MGSRIACENVVNKNEVRNKLLDSLYTREND